MRGSPPVQLALLLAGFILVAIPLMQLTHANGPTRSTPATAEAKPASQVPTTLRVKYAHKPISLSITLDGKDLIPAADLSSSPLEVSVDLTIPKEGLELQAHAAWPEGTPETALTLELVPDSLDRLTQTNWSTGNNLNETYLFQWKP